MGEKRLARIPEDHDVYMLSMQTGWMPDDIRKMSKDDFYWMQIYPEAIRLAREELKRRGANKDEKK